ncbi:hypothetical protein PENTCL1PPCAC_23934, partial [Pristionchus entomophagus]
MIISAKARELILDFFQLDPIEEDFLKKYSQIVPNSHLCVSSHDEHLQTSLLRPSDDLSGGLSSFETLMMPKLQIDTNWLVPAITERLRQRRQGTWRFRSSRRITGMD